ncbi:MAG: hypothetical protein NC826_02035 [Candidatus Omnitrophica bacterium]|nr:hypothetical protein [Candidatus Omnitrophota bacterium]
MMCYFTFYLSEIVQQNTLKSIPVLLIPNTIQKIIEDLERNNTDYIVLWDDPLKIIEPNESNKSSGVILLDEYIQKNIKL